MWSNLYRTTLLFFIFLWIGIYSQLIAESRNSNLSQAQIEQAVQENHETSKDTPKESKGIDWFELIIIVGYLGGVFILLPIVVYTNQKEKLFNSDSDDQSQIMFIERLSEAERNQKALEILEKIESKLTSFKGEDGSELITITKGSQAKFMKFGLDYINKRLKPADAAIIERVKEFTDVYNDRTRRAFTGSNWVIGCGIAVGILFYMTGGISVFLFIHFLGLVFYFLSSRTTFYGIEKRMSHFGNGKGFISGLMAGLFLGNGVKYYVKEGNGPWKRDWETEGQMALMGLVLLLIAAMILGIFAAFLGVLNFIINYSTSFLHPFQSEEKWYEKNFLQLGTA